MHPSEWYPVESLLLGKLAEVSQVKVAQLMNVSEASVSALKSPHGRGGASHIETTARLIVALGLRLVPADARVAGPGEATFDAAYVRSLQVLARQHLERMEAQHADRA